MVSVIVNSVPLHSPEEGKKITHNEDNTYLLTYLLIYSMDVIHDSLPAFYGT
jgi:hypothetical protein